MRLFYIFFTLVLITVNNLSAESKVLAFSGSTRTDSVNKKLVKEAANIARSLGAEVTEIDLKELPMPLYDGDLEAAEGMPENTKTLRNLMIQSDVILIATPEYNHSIPAVLKNALDWVSRSEKAERSKEAFQGKKFAIMSASPGKGGGAKGLIHLRDILVDQKAVVLPTQVSIPDAYNAFDDNGSLKDAKLLESLVKLVQESLQKG